MLNSYEGKYAVVVGGGATARKYAKAVRKLGGNEYQADSSAILATKENASVLLTKLKDVLLMQREAWVS